MNFGNAVLRLMQRAARHAKPAGPTVKVLPVNAVADPPPCEGKVDEDTGLPAWHGLVHGQRHTVYAQTKSEARAVLKRKLGTDRLPAGIQLRAGA